MPYLQLRGLGFEDTTPDGGPFSNWDWHEWLLAGIGVFVVGRSVLGGVSSVVGTVKRSRSKSRKRKQRISAAKRDLEDAMAS